MGDAAKLDEHIPAVSESSRRLVEVERDERDAHACYLHSPSLRLSLLRRAASTAGLNVGNYGPAAETAHQMRKEGLLAYDGPFRFVLTAAGLAALEQGGR